MYENDELLYTQEDMDEWMRTCENLQEHIKEQEEEIRELQKQMKEKDEQIKYLEDLCDKERLKAISLQQQIREEKTSFDMYRANIIQKGIADPEATKIIRKQVCDEIRNAVNCLTSFECDFGCDIVFKKRFDKYLDQIEKGSDNE